MYAVIATFDTETEQAIHQIWQGLAENGLSDYAAERSGMEPHLTLASYAELSDLPAMNARLEAHYANQVTLSINLTSLGTFLGSQLVFLAPQITVDLLDFHAKHHKAFDDQLDPTSHYAPKAWSPHVSLANYLSESNFPAAFAYCQNHLIPLSAQITTVKLIKIKADKSVEVMWENKLA